MQAIPRTLLYVGGLFAVLPMIININVNFLSNQANSGSYLWGTIFAVGIIIVLVAYSVAGHKLLRSGRPIWASILALIVILPMGTAHTWLFFVVTAIVEGR